LLVEPNIQQHPVEANDTLDEVQCVHCIGDSSNDICPKIPQVISKAMAIDGSSSTTKTAFCEGLAMRFGAH
jgi:hypothetical protein